MSLAAEGGPWAWVAFALGELVVFTAACFAASEGVAYIYELTLEEW